MALPVIAGALRISVGGVIAGGGRWSNTWHALQNTPSTWDLAEITAFNDIFQELYMGAAPATSGGLMFWCPTATTVQGADYTPLDGSSGAYNFPWGGFGGSADPPAPAEVAEVITLRTALRGRQNRGRVYLPAWGHGYYDGNGHINATSALAVTALCDSIQARLVTGGAHLAVGSYGPYKNPVTHLLEAGTPHLTPITSFTMDLLADVQRHRKN